MEVQELANRLLGDRELDRRHPVTIQRHQARLSDRHTGGPHEQQGTKAQRLRRTRSTPILLNSLYEPLTRWKTLEPLYPRWPQTWRRYHLLEGIRVVDQEVVNVSARDQVTKTPKGGIRHSSGMVSFDTQHQQKIMIDADDLIEILVTKPNNSTTAWTLAQLERQFRTLFGRPGTWWHYEIPFVTYLSVFPKTFEVFGTRKEYVRLKHPWSTSTRARVLDHKDEVMTSLARIKQRGLVAYQKMAQLNEVPAIIVNAESGKHRLKTHIDLFNPVPDRYFPIEGNEKYGLPLTPNLDAREAAALQDSKIPQSHHSRDQMKVTV